MNLKDLAYKKYAFIYIVIKLWIKYNIYIYIPSYSKYVDIISILLCLIILSDAYKWYKIKHALFCSNHQIIW